MRQLAILILLLLTTPAQAELFQFPARTGETARLVIYSSADTDRMIKLIETFQDSNPTIALDYHLLDTLEIYQRTVRELDGGRASADLLISSAMDLQIKLVNDGYALPHESPETESLPEWANWRNEAFGFTFEPAVLVYNKELHPDLSDIRTRFDLAQRLILNPTRFGGKVVTYDPQKSGLGFMFSTQDAIQSEDFWYLARALGTVDTVLESSSAAMINKVADGRALLAYNVLGSYATARAQDNPALHVLIPEDYGLVMSRVAMIPRTSRQPEAAGLFIDFLLSNPGQTLVAGAASLFAIRPDVQGGSTASSLQQTAKGPLLPIKLGPGLLVYLDRMKRQTFLTRWERAMGQE